jgi:hypothetical protein
MRRDPRIGKELLGKHVDCSPNTAARLLARYRGETRGHSSDQAYRLLLRIAKRKKNWSDHALTQTLAKEGHIDFDQARCWVARYRGATLPRPTTPAGWTAPHREKPDRDRSVDLYGKAKAVLKNSNMGSHKLARELGCTKTTARCLRQRYMGETEGHAKHPDYDRVVAQKKAHPSWGPEQIARQLGFSAPRAKLWLARYKGALARGEQDEPAKAATPASTAPQCDPGLNFWDSMDRGTRTLGVRGREITTVEDLLRKEGVDLDVWHIESSHLERKHHPEGEITFVKVVLRKALLEERLRAISESLAKGAQAAAVAMPITPHRPSGSGILFELSLPDLHLGKYSARDETGEAYNVEIAKRLTQDAIEDLLEQAANHHPEQILIAIGNDFYNVDSEQKATANGTPQDEELRWHQTFAAGKELTAYQIQRSLRLAPVHVVIVPGNHDKHRVWHLGEVLKSHFRTTPEVTFDNRAAPRKYYVWGQILLGFTHGDLEKHERLPMLMANEQPKAWASSTYRE